ncbi:MAG TPA: hypothetical protein VMV69_05200 [Pirellulales bacterium]|nr:hypothetical protein [Pirellulales bacterium]
MRRSKVKAKLSRGEPVLVPALHFTDPSIYELTSLMGFDCIWMDLAPLGFTFDNRLGQNRGYA